MPVIHGGSMLRRKLKRALFEKLLWFPYYGETVHFPPESFLFRLACEQGVYEHANVRLLLELVKPGTTFFDVGANIGLMALPILRGIPECSVVSFEPSPQTVACLRRTAARSSFAPRWSVVDKAVGARPGYADFHVARHGMGAFDALHPTNRGGVPFDLVKIPVTTLDLEWERLGRPRVSAIKIDVEGNELDVIAGAANCIRAQRPCLLTEWNTANATAAGRRTSELIAAAADIDYGVYCLPHMVPVPTPTVLGAQMLVSENFLLVPNAGTEETL